MSLFPLGEMHERLAATSTARAAPPQSKTPLTPGYGLRLPGRAPPSSPWIAPRGKFDLALGRRIP